MAAIARRQRSSSPFLGSSKALLLFTVVAVATLVFVTLSLGLVPDEFGQILGGDASFGKERSLLDVDFQVDEACKNLPTFQPGGSYFLDGNIKAGTSPDGFTPSFKVGSYFADKVKYHMGGDVPNFRLIQDVLKDREGGLTFDIGANQGFYTYFLATIGAQVHAFEINEQNFKALQHGAEFNPKEVADRVHVYPYGVGEKNARFSMQGNGYGGFLKEGSSGPILGVSMDCFAHHMKGKLDFSNVAFVKIDVEGFEIAVLRGARNSLFKRGYSKIGGLIIEVGPERWARASINLSEGVDEMKNLSTHFENSYVLIRVSGGHEKSCPLALAEDLSDKNPSKFDNVNMFKVKYDEWGSLLSKMEKNKYDCNFYYRN